MQTNEARYNVVRLLEDGDTYVKLGSNLTADKAAEAHAFHAKCDRRYRHSAEIRNCVESSGNPGQLNARTGAQS